MHRAHHTHPVALTLATALLCLLAIVGCDTGVGFSDPGAGGGGGGANNGGNAGNNDNGANNNNVGGGNNNVNNNNGGGGGGGALLSGVNFVLTGKPAGGHNVTTDLQVFNGRLYMTTSASPLRSFGANVHYTTNGTNFTTVINDATSQGFLRLRVWDSMLMIPDGDPNGLDPSFVYVSTDGTNFAKDNVPGAVHTFDVIKYAGKYICSNGMANSNAGLCSSPNPGSSDWVSIEEIAVSRLKYMAKLNGRLFAGKRNPPNIGADLVFWDGDPASNEAFGQNIDPNGGDANTFRFFKSSANRLYWSYGSDALHIRSTTDGSTWTVISSLDGKFISDMVEFDGNIYALSHDGLWGSTDGTTFTQICAAPAGQPFHPEAVGGGINPESVASLAVYNGQIWAGSSTNGSLYVVK